MQFINLTPHKVSMFSHDGQLTNEWLSEGTARCAQKNKTVGSLNGIPVFRNTYGEVTGLPEPKEGVVYIVSMLVQQALKGERVDLVSPNDVVRSIDGTVVGCRSWCVI